MWPDWQFFLQGLCMIVDACWCRNVVELVNPCLLLLLSGPGLPSIWVQEALVTFNARKLQVVAAVQQRSCQTLWRGFQDVILLAFQQHFDHSFYMPVWLCLGSSFGLVLHRPGYKHGQCRRRHRCCHAGLLFESPNSRLFAGWSRCLRTGWFENFELAPVIIMDAISDWSFELTFHTKEWQTSGHFLDSRPGWKQLLQSLPWHICRTALSKVLVMGRRGVGDFSGSWAQQSSRSEL